MLHWSLQPIINLNVCSIFTPLNIFFQSYGLTFTLLCSRLWNAFFKPCTRFIWWVFATAGRVVRRLEGEQHAESVSAMESNPALLSLSQLLCLSPLRGWHRNPSKAFYQAFQSGSRLRDSKAHSDRYSTILDWAGWACKSVTTCVWCSAATSFAFSLSCFFLFFCTLPPRAWTEFENKAWQPVRDWPTGFLTSSPSLSVIFLPAIVFSLTVHFVPRHSNVLITWLLFKLVW